MTSRRLLKLGLSLLAVLGLAAGALAYWTTQGSGSASANVGTLSAATISAANTSTGSITISWSEQASLESAPSLDSSITYTVERKAVGDSSYAAVSGGACSGSLPHNTTSCTDSVDAGGSYYYRVVAQYHSSWTAISNEAGPVNADATPPTVQSISRHTSSPTNAASVQFDVSFSESVSGVDLSDFALATTGVTGASKTSISGSGASYTVTVDTGSGDGTLGLNLVDDDSIQDGAGNKLGGTGTGGAGNGSLTGPLYTVDKTVPTVQSISRHTSSPTNAASVQFDVSFSESVSGVDLSDFALATTGVTGASKTSISGSGASYTVTVDTGSGDGTIGLNLVDDDSIQDGAGNKLGGTGTGGAGNGSLTGPLYTVDKTAPVLSVTKVNGSTVTFPYSTNVASVTSIGGSCGNLSGDSTTVSVSITGTASQTGTATCASGSWTYTTSPALSTAGSYTVSATQSDTAGNSGSSGNQALTIDRTVPTRTALELFDTNNNGKVDKVKATYNEALGTYAAGTSPWTLTNVPSSGSLASVSVSGSVVTLNLTEGAGAPDTSVGTFKVAYTAPGSGGVVDTAGNAAASFASTSPSDLAAPALTLLQMFDSNTPNGKVDQLKATFSEALSASTATIPWTLANVPSGGSLSSVSVSGAVATLTLTEGAGAADTSVGSFTVALATSGTGIRDAAGNQSSFTAQAPADKAGPVAVSITDTDGANNGKFEQDDAMTIAFSESVIGVAASSNVTLVGGSGSAIDSVTMTNLLSGTASLNRNDYMGASNKSAAFTGSTLSQPAANQVKVTLAACSGDCSSIGTGAAAAGSFTFAPVTTITDAAGNAAAGSITVSIRLF